MSAEYNHTQWEDLKSSDVMKRHEGDVAEMKMQEVWVQNAAC